jgi:hypothetical protein
MRYVSVFAELALLAPLSAAMTSAPAMAQSQIKLERVSFAPGVNTTTVVRTIRGSETIDFLISARTGQRLEASMTSSNTAAYFNVLEPGSTDEAVYVGSMSSPFNNAGWTVQRSGDLRIRVYLYRAAANRGESASIRLNIALTGQGGTATQLPGQLPGQGGTVTQLPGQGGSVTQLPGDALVPGTNYHATGLIDCRFRLIGRFKQCQQGVIRLGGGTASVTIRKPDGTRRTITFNRGTPVGYDQDLVRPVAMTWSKLSYQTTVRIGLETYVIPDAVVFGG